MPKMDIGSAIEPAFKHMANMLFRPFVLRMWLSLGFISIMCGGAGSGNIRIPDFSNWSNSDKTRHEFLPSGSPFPEISVLLLVILGAVIVLAIALLFGWLASVFQFVYVDDIVRKSGAIKEPFARLKKLGTSYFLWNLAFGLIFLLALGILVGLPLMAVFIPEGVGMGAKVVAVVWAVIIGIALIILMSIIDIFARDFVVTAMYVRGIRVMEGWRTVLPILKANAGQVVLYILLLIAFAIASGIFGLVVFLASALLFAIPVGILALLGYLIGLALHLTWTPLVIGIVVALGLPVFFAFIYFVQCAVQPAMIFRRAFPLVALGQADPSLVTISNT